ncbi:maleylpyruvate isomerase family mycothiol-dependent enzyme [Streptomyces sp. WMMC897]|uniref:maleylpyruvate isomerase family mycothiol-dependent enzyme n=1 Tax=Streptomyces sp. WMMC897 TaxID=3014782 RepID=UPI0022B74842|nr:maleylpyruvate isomerase family mycothiol-dependent enzyme [Streptomyces sp. WMMC897]MCZ7413641.1 maleylpyruvate isomerase family mycothiol-dependent enzyme [Streptomyces sp. WMMC897]
MNVPQDDVAALQESTDALLAAVSRLDDASLTEPSGLPGWTRGHVLAHLARNADALVNVLEGRPMYASAEAREADIESGAPRPLAAQLDDLRATAERLGAAFARYEGERWEERVELRNGVTDRAGAIPFRRQVEVELHHVDLDAGRKPDDMPAAFTEALIGYLARRFSGNPDVPATELRTEDGRTWRTGRGAEAGGPEVTVTGAPGALAGWLAGRTDGTGLSAGPGALPVLPPL